MAKKTLEEKIKLVWQWALGLSILYFVIGAILKSDGANFDPAKTYELIKDTLTLTATFLAPVAAFVLFSDWREQHRAIKIESESEVVYQELRKLFLTFKKSLLAIRTHIQDENLLKKEKQKNQIHLDILTTTLSSLSSRMGDEAVKEFIEAVDEILKKYFRMYEIFEEIHLFHKYQVHQPFKDVLERELPDLIKNHKDAIFESQQEVLEIIYGDIRDIFFLSTRLKA